MVTVRRMTFFDTSEPSWPHIHNFHELRVMDEWMGSPMDTAIHLLEKYCYCWDDPDVHDQCVCSSCVELYRDWYYERSKIDGEIA